MLDEVCKRVAKKMKQFNTVTSVVNTDLTTIATTVNTGGGSIATFAKGVVLRIETVLSRTSQFFFFCNNNYRKIS